MKYKISVILITCLYLFGCNKTNTVVYQNKAFEDISSFANKKHSFFYSFHSI
jgi:hypothetical protein